MLTTSLLGCIWLQSKDSTQYPNAWLFHFWFQSVWHKSGRRSWWSTNWDSNGPHSVTQKWKKIMMVNKLRQQWSPTTTWPNIFWPSLPMWWRGRGSKGNLNCAPIKAKRESKHTMSSIKWTVYNCNFSCYFLRFLLKEFALQVHLKALQVHKSDSQSVCMCTQPNSCPGMSIFFNLPLYTILLVFSHFTTLMAVLDQPFESHTVQMSKVMHTVHIIASGMSATDLHRFT